MSPFPYSLGFIFLFTDVASDDITNSARAMSERFGYSQRSTRQPEILWLILELVFVEGNSHRDCRSHAGALHKVKCKMANMIPCFGTEKLAPESGTTKSKITTSCFIEHWKPLLQKRVRPRCECSFQNCSKSCTIVIKSSSKCVIEFCHRLA